jgi:TM2 domain-containing membrane protein YozV
MALVQCPECSIQVSDKAIACPSCGYPISPSGVNTVTVSEKVPDKSQNDTVSVQAVSLVKSAKSRGIYIILGLFFGLLGIHNFYAGYYGRGAIQLLLILILGWVVIGFIIVVPWVLIDLFVVTTDASGDKMV